MSNKLLPGWQRVPLRKVARVCNGSTPSRQEQRYWNEGVYPWLPTGKVNDRIITKADEYITQAGIDEWPMRIIPQGSVLVGMIGQGKTRGMVAFLGIDATINQNFAAIIPSGNLDGKYLFYFLDASYEALRDLSHGSNQGALNCKLIGGFHILLPTLPEQRKIGQILGTWDAAILGVEQLIAALQRRKQGLMQRLLTGQVRFRESEGEEWKETELSELVAPVTRAETVSPAKEYRLIGVRWYLEGAYIHDVVPGAAIVSQSLSRIEEGDILYNKMWVSKAAFAVATREHAGAYGTGEYPQFRAKVALDTRFLAYAFHVLRFQHDATALCRGTTGRIRLHPRDFLHLKITLPTLAEQRKIAEFFTTIDREIALQKQRLEQLRAQKKGLMQRLLTGQVRMNVEETVTT